MQQWRNRPKGAWKRAPWVNQKNMDARFEYLKGHDVKEELPDEFQGVVAFVPGLGFIGAIYSNGQWLATPILRDVNPTYWYAPISRDEILQEAYENSEIS